MKPEGVFSLKDFLYYYFPGVAWLLCIAAIIFPLGRLAESGQFFMAWNRLLGLVSPAIWLLLLVFGPYLMGFVANPIGYNLTYQLKQGDRDSITWVVKKHKKRNALDAREVSQIKKRFLETFGFEIVS